MSPEEVYCKQARIPLVAELASRKLVHFELASRILNLKSSDFFWSTVWTFHHRPQASGRPCATTGPLETATARVGRPPPSARRLLQSSADLRPARRQRAGASSRPVSVLSGIEDAVAPRPPLSRSPAGPKAGNIYL